MTNDTDDEGIWCYFDENGKMIMDQMDRKINGNYYTFIDGKMQTGWVNVAEAGFISSAALRHRKRGGFLPFLKRLPLL